MNRSVERAIAILEYIASAGHPVGISEISKELGIPKSSASDCLSTLRENGCLAQEKTTYIIGERSKNLGLKLVSDIGIGKSERSVITGIRDSTGLSASLWERDGRRVNCIFAAPYEKLKRLSSSVGDSCEAYLTAPGKAILAALSDDEVGELIGTGCYPVHTSRSITTFYNLTTELSKIRQAGYAVEEFENDSHVFAVAAAFRHENGKMMAVSVELRAANMTPPAPHASALLARKVIEAAEILGKRTK